jgi:hypothetical protein
VAARFQRVACAILLSLRHDAVCHDCPSRQATDRATSVPVRASINGNYTMADEQTDKVKTLTDRISPILHGHDPKIQGAVLAEDERRSSRRTRAAESRGKESRDQNAPVCHRRAAWCEVRANQARGDDGSRARGSDAGVDAMLNYGIGPRCMNRGGCHRTSGQPATW